MLEVKDGSRWHDGKGHVFHVLSIKQIEEHTWVHYRREDNKLTMDQLPGENEYSCYLESFVSRFNPMPT